MLFREELAQDVEQPPPYEASGAANDNNGDDDSGFGHMSAKEWYGENAHQQPEMAEKGAGLVAEMAAAAGSRSTDTDAAMTDAEGSQHIEFADGK